MNDLAPTLRSGFVPLIETPSGWAFVYRNSFVEITEPNVWVEGEMLGVKVRARLLSDWVRPSCSKTAQLLAS